ncbi:hypothetical protein JCM10908_003974 [Rhodotorula pacifica]|uniref:GAF domain-containing protein n=1 Tax=Rhodotorula pacifica TaxID=1495444 RepID=UPI0031822BBE
MRIAIDDLLIPVPRSDTGTMPAASYLAAATAHNPSAGTPSSAAPQPSFLKRKFFSLSSKSRNTPLLSSKRTAGPYSSNAPGQWTASRTQTSRRAMPPDAVEETTQQFGALDFATRPILRAVNYVKEKLSSRSPLDLLPKSWREYIELYRSNRIDLDDPPLPPEREAAPGAPPTAFEQGQWSAPLPANEALRQDIVNRLDLFGTKHKRERSASRSSLDLTVAMERSATDTSDAGSTRAGSIAETSRRAPSIVSTTPATSEAEGADSLENHPIFRSIIAKCREVFSADIGLLTVLDDDTQMFLASAGVPDGVGNVLPRAASFCGHTILNDDGGMVVLDSSQDWRFAKALPTAHLGVRFYAGSPVTAPTDDPMNPTVPIGSLCILDTKPRTEFSEAHRRMLKDLARQASDAIEVWWRERVNARMAKLESSLVTGSAPRLIHQALARGPLSNASTASISSRPKSPPPALPLPPIPPMSPFRPRTDSIQSTAPTLEVAAPRQPLAHALSVTTEDPLSSVPRDAQDRMDTGTRLLAKALELEFTYLVAIDLSPEVTPQESLRVLAAHGLPSPPPVFDPSLHLKALRAPEGGLVYKNPRFAHVSSSSFAAGILIPVLEVRRTGYVLCAYTRQAKRDFSQRDLTYMVKFAQALETACIKASR